jgi:hypothetical protein
VRVRFAASARTTDLPAERTALYKDQGVVDLPWAHRPRARTSICARSRGAGPNLTFAAGTVLFNKGDPGDCMYIVQSGMIEMVIGDKIIETVGPNEAIGFMSMVDSAPRSSTARVKEACELSVIDGRTSASWST